MQKPQPASETRYCVLYRSGGTHWATWQRLLEVYTLEAARTKRDELIRMGYRALVQSAGQLERIGMPYGWEHDSVNWADDEITTECDKHGLPCRTVHIKREVTA